MELGAGTLVYGVIAGASASIAVVFVVISLRQVRRDSVYLAFGAVGLASALVTVATVRLHKSSRVDEYVDLLKILGMLNLVMLVSFVGLIVVWTRSVPRAMVAVFLGASAVIAVLQVALPEGLLAADVATLRRVELFGESFVVHEGGSSPWRPVLDAYLLLSAVTVGTALVRCRRTVGPGVAAVLTGSVAVTILFGVYDSFVDQGAASTPYLGPIGNATVVVMAATYLGLQLADSERRLRMQNARLEETVLARTAALIDANRRLENTVERQRTSVRHLSDLARQFETMNAVALPLGDRDRIARSLEEVLGDLGRLVGAERVELSLGELEDVPIDAQLEWSATAAEPLDRAPIRVPLTVSARQLGELTIWPTERSLEPERRRYVELAAEHLAGFVERVELAGRIASSAIQAERRRIAQELHDSVTQKLYSVSFLAEALPNQLPDEAEEARRIAMRMRQILLTSLAELRTLMFELHPAALERATLAQLLQQLCEMIDAACSVDVELSMTEGPRVPTDVRVGMYRIAQEALTNVARHSDAETAQVSLCHIPRGLELRICDDGRGFETEGQHIGHGLRNMNERAEAIGAGLSVRSGTDCGTTVVARWVEPARAPSDSDAPGVATDVMERAS